MAATTIPAGFHTITPYLIVSNAAGLADFLRHVFDAEQVSIVEEDGVMRHGEFRIGDSMLMLSEASNDYPAMPAMLYVYVDDVDTVFQRALAAGATSVRKPRDEHYGDRSGGVADMCGNQWWMATHLKDQTS